MITRSESGWPKFRILPVLAIALVGFQNLSVSADATETDSAVESPRGIGANVLYRDFDLDGDELLVYYREDIMDDCLPSAQSQQAHWMGRLQSHGFRLTETFSPDLFSLSVSMVGFGNTLESCVFNITTTYSTPLGRFELKDGGSASGISVPIWKHSSLHGSHRSRFEAKVRSQSDIHLDKFLEEFDHYSGRRLLGTWKGNAEMSIESMEQTRMLTDDAREAWVEVLGSPSLVFTNEHALFDMGVAGVDVMEMNYRILHIGRSRITVEFSTAERGVEETVEFHFKGNCMSRPIPGQDFRQFFCRETVED